MTEQYKIEKGVPMPHPYAKGSGWRKYPWHEMDVGDSFFVGVEQISDNPASLRQSRANEKVRSSLLQSAKNYRLTSHEASSKTFKVAYVEGGVRAWRTS